MQTQVPHNVQNAAADASAAASAALASVTWMAQLNAALQLVATVVAIIAGLGAAWWHFEKAWTAHQERRRDKPRDD